MKTGQNILSLFPNKKPIIGMIHLKGEKDEEIFERAKREIEILVNNGIDGLMLENYYGNYYHLERILEYVKSENPGVPYGVNCLNVDALGFDLAGRYDAEFLQVDSVVGHVKPRDEASLEVFFKKYRKLCPAYLIGGVRFKYQPVLSEKTVEEDLRIGMTRCDAIAVTGNATGEETSMDKIKLFRTVAGDFPLVVAAGMTGENAREQLAVGDMAIIGSYFKENYKDFGEMSQEHVRDFMKIIKGIREEN